MSSKTTIPRARNGTGNSSALIAGKLDSCDTAQIDFPDTLQRTRQVSATPIVTRRHSRAALQQSARPTGCAGIQWLITIPTREPERIPGKVNVTAFCNGWCMAVNLVYERAKRAAAELGDPVVFREIDVSTREAVAEWGTADAVLIDGKNPQKGPPPSYERIRSMMVKRLRVLPSS